MPLLVSVPVTAAVTPASPSALPVFIHSPVARFRVLPCSSPALFRVVWCRASAPPESSMPACWLLSCAPVAVRECVPCSVPPLVTDALLNCASVPAISPLFVRLAVVSVRPSRAITRPSASLLACRVRFSSSAVALSSPLLASVSPLSVSVPLLRSAPRLVRSATPSVSAESPSTVPWFCRLSAVMCRSLAAILPAFANAVPFRVSRSSASRRPVSVLVRLR